MEEILRAATSEHLRSELGRLDIAVSARSLGRSTKQVERYSIAHLLATISAARLTFPLTVTHSDKPDFVLSMPSGTVGIEHTEAVPENVARGEFLREKGLGPEVYFTLRATPGEPRKSAAELREEIEADEPGSGWAGDSAEREWATAMAHFVIKKISKATAPDFARHPENWLMIYDNWPLPHIDFAKAASLLYPLLREIKAFATFDAIFVMDDQQMCELRDSPIVYGVVEPGSRI